MLIACRFIDQYIFPGGYLPSTMQLLNHINTQSNGSLTLERVENIGGHYVKTLRLWRENFLLNFDEKIRPALLHSNPEMSKDAIEVFRKKWEVRVVIVIPRPIKLIATDVVIQVLLFILRSWIFHQGPRRCHHHRRSRNSPGVHGRYTALNCYHNLLEGFQIRVACEVLKSRDLGLFK